MSKLISELMGIDDPLFHLNLQNLEKATNNSGVDVRLSGDIIAKSHQKMRELGLDPKDTTATELYHSLIELTKKHDEFLAKKLNVNDPTDTEQVLKAIQFFIQKIDMPKSVLAIKQSSAKRILKLLPPKKVMKQLGYRSVDSLLKRESMSEIIAGIKLLESQTFQESLAKKYRQLKGIDFESRDVEVKLLEGKKWSQTFDELINNYKQNIVSVQELGSIILLPLPVKSLNGISITILPLVIQRINELRAKSNYLRSKQFSPKFSQVYSEYISGQEEPQANLAGHQVSWKQIHRHFGTKVEGNADFEPQKISDDNIWQRTEDALYHIEPALHFWFGMDYVGIKTEQGVISFNLMDNAINLVNGFKLGQQVSSNLSVSLNDELYARYMNEKSLENQLIRQLDNKTDDSNDMEFELQESF